MIKKLLLISALTFAPVVASVCDEAPIVVYAEGEVEEAPIVDEEPIVDDKKDDEEIDLGILDDEDWKEALSNILGKVFDAKTVSIIMMVVGYVIMGIKFLASTLKSKKLANLTANDVKDEVLKAMGDKVDESVKNQVASSIYSVAQTCKNLNNVVKVLAEVMALSQENTPESRVAILECIAKLGVVDAQVTEQAKEVVNQQVADEEQKKEDTIKAIEGMKNDGTEI